MTPRDRVLTALDHKQPDRVPLDFGGHRSSRIAAMAYPGLRRALGLPERPIRVYDIPQQLAMIDDDVLDRLGVDTIELGRGFALEDEHWTDWTLPDGTPCQVPAWNEPERVDGQWILRGPSGTPIAQMPDGAIYFEQCHWPFLEDDDFDRLGEALANNMWCGIKTPPGPLVEGLGGLDRLAEGARRLRARTDRAIIGLFGGNLLEIGQFLYRNDKFFMLPAGDPDRCPSQKTRLRCNDEGQGASCVMMPRIFMPWNVLRRGGGPITGSSSLFPEGLNIGKRAAVQRTIHE